MINDYRFFQDFFDGQIIKPESEKYKLFKLMLVSIISVVGIFFASLNMVSLISFFVLEIGMIWNFYLKLNNVLSFISSLAIGVLCLLICLNYSLVSNALVYIACYIPFQLVANGKDYSDGDFIQIRKQMTNYNKILFIVFFTAMFMIFTILSSLNENNVFWLFDSLSASLLLCSAILRNERYFEYYIFRFFALAISIILWSLILANFGIVDSLMIIMMYVAYLIFDLTTLIYQSKTYVNEYMLIKKRYEESENKKLVEEKLKIYRNLKNTN